jgi:hypothetical protein
VAPTIQCKVAISSIANGGKVEDHGLLGSIQVMERLHFFPWLRISESGAFFGPGLLFGRQTADCSSMPTDPIIIIITSEPLS